MKVVNFIRLSELSQSFCNVWRPNPKSTSKPYTLCTCGKLRGFDRYSISNIVVNKWSYYHIAYTSQILSDLHKSTGRFGIGPYSLFASFIEMDPKYQTTLKTMDEILSCQLLHFIFSHRGGFPNTY